MKLQPIVVLASTFVLVCSVTTPSYGGAMQKPQEGSNEQHTMNELEKVQHTEFSSAAPLQDVAPAQLSDENQKMEHEFLCHVAGNMFEPHDYNLESWRPSEHWALQLNPFDECNPK